MLEMTEATVIHQRPSEQVTTTECNYCYSLQPCYIGDSKRGARCVDWHDCLVRQQENCQPDRPQLTPADQSALLDRLEIMTADMERLKRIASVASVFVQASEAFDRVRGHGPVLALHSDLMDAEKKLIAAVKS